MACYSLSRSFIVTIFYFFTFSFKSLSADYSNISFSLNNFTGNKDSSFYSFLDLYGDAKFTSSSLRLTVPSPWSAGRVIYKNPIKIYGGTPEKLVSISTYFSFSLSKGNLLSFLVFPTGYPFNINASSGVLSSRKFKPINVVFEDHIAIDSSSFMSVKVMNLSSLNLVINGSEKMQTWIDYQPGSKRLEVRLNRFGSSRPIDPQLFVNIDLLKIWPKNEGVFVGLSSSNGNSSERCKIDSWRFRVSRAPDWLHSQPLDPSDLKFNPQHQVRIFPKESDCVRKIIAALILGIGCGSLATLAVMFLYTVFWNRNRQPIVPEEFAVKSLQEYEHKKLKIVLDEASANEN